MLEMFKTYNGLEFLSSELISIARRTRSKDKGQCLATHNRMELLREQIELY